MFISVQQIIYMICMYNDSIIIYVYKYTYDIELKIIHLWKKPMCLIWSFCQYKKSYQIQVKFHLWFHKVKDTLKFQNDKSIFEISLGINHVYEWLNERLKLDSQKNET